MYFQIFSLISLIWKKEKQYSFIIISFCFLNIIVTDYYAHKFSGSTSSYRKSRNPNNLHGLLDSCIFLSYSSFSLLCSTKLSTLLPRKIPIKINTIRTISFLMLPDGPFLLVDISFMIYCLYRWRSYNSFFRDEYFSCKSSWPFFPGDCDEALVLPKFFGVR